MRRGRRYRRPLVLILDDEHSWTAITQPAHAWVSAQVARHWGNDDFAPPEPLEEVVLGIEQHDIAWADWDLRPPLHPPARRAASFLEVPPVPRLAIWDDAPRRALAQSPWAALLVSLHGRNIHTRFGDPSQLPPDLTALLHAYLERQRGVQAELVTALGIDEAVAERAGDLLFALDSLSLRICHGWPAGDLPAVDGAVVTVTPDGEDAFVLDPWPLRVDRLEVHLTVRTLAERFDDEAALHAALDAAPWTRRAWTLHPG